MTGIRKSFGPVPVLKNVDFAVNAGEIHALLGANGAGKSTLIKILGGQYGDAEGTIALDGRPITLDSTHSSLRAGIGIVHQEVDLVPVLSVAENIYLGREQIGMAERPPLLSRVRRRAVSGAARDLLRQYHLGLDPDDIVSALPASAKQIAQIARVLALQSDVMVFDEPTARLGKRDREALFTTFRLLQSAGKKIIFVTHYLDEVIQIADRASVMRDGQMVATVQASETSPAELSRLMVGADVVKPRRSRSGIATTPCLEVRDLADGTSFSGVNFDIGAGEIVGLVGHLGSGRHELTRCLVGSRTFSGRADLVHPQPAKPLRRRDIGFVPEDRRAEGIFPDLSIGTNIYVGQMQSRPLRSLVRHRSVGRVADRLIAALQIKTSHHSQPIAELSGGNQQKAVFGRAIVSQPPIFIVESPTVGVDVKAGAELHAQLFALASRGAAILLATDDLDEVLTVCDRVLVMFRGKIVDDLPAETMTHHRLVGAMGAS